MAGLRRDGWVLAAVAGGLTAVPAAGGDAADAEVGDGRDVLEGGAAAGVEVVHGVGHRSTGADTRCKGTLRNASAP